MGLLGRGRDGFGVLDVIRIDERRSAGAFALLRRKMEHISMVQEQKCDERREKVEMGRYKYQRIC